MEGDVKVGDELSHALDAFKQALAAAILSVPSVPAGQALVSATPFNVDIFNNKPIEVIVDENPALAVWVNAITAKLNAFAKG
ncbi:MAG TPA: hypothetical protein VL492_11670 [Methylovirgula sp.]|nr:hypothetical protein [Methylovirgula sp.]